MAKLRCLRNAATLSKEAKPTQAPRPLAPSSSLRKAVVKRSRFLQRVQASGLAAKSAVLLRKKASKAGKALGSLGALQDALPLVQVAATPLVQSALMEKGRSVVHAKARMRRDESEALRFTAVLSNARFQADPVSSVTNHILAMLPSADIPMVRAPEKRRKVGSKAGQR